jgi:hypothetical protein
LGLEPVQRFNARENAVGSTFIPRIFGVGMMLAGSGWLIFLWPPVAHVLFQYVPLFGIGELALPLWLILKGVNAERWH